jgi:mannose-6-phosphate isomerase class I
MTDAATRVWRRTSQALAPAHKPPHTPGAYDLYPAFPLPDGQIETGFDALARLIAGQRAVTIDGYGGVLWDSFRNNLDDALMRLGIHVRWYDVSEALRTLTEIDHLTAPFMGGEDPLFGTAFTGSLADFFYADRLAAMQPAEEALSIVYGTGAALARWRGLLIYVDIPKNEIQFRARAGTIANLGLAEPTDPKAMYKRFFFVDWPALSLHKAGLLPRINVMVDGQRPDEPTFLRGEHLRAGLDRMSRGYVRARPWFEPGPWGGQWLKQHIPDLPQDVPNYAWSFELISPENGIAFSSDEMLLEVSFDCLMFHAHERVLGNSAARFGNDFPIRFDFLDTFDGGNLSVQCHPRPDYIREHFGQPFTQDETYYILDSAPGAQVYLGFRDDIDPDKFRTALEDSFSRATPLAVEQYVNVEPAHIGDLFLIPGGTIHCAGTNTLVLEISATTYIFTFKMYDWMRLDLDGRPRPLNIARAFDNLDFDRKGERIRREFISTPVPLAQGDSWSVVHLPTHADHFYDVHRLEFSASIAVETHGSPHVLNLVQGRSVLLETASGEKARFSFAETFMVPAAAGHYTLTSEDGSPLKVIKGFMKS